jgi:hypothetical protein
MWLLLEGTPLISFVKQLLKYDYVNFSSEEIGNKWYREENEMLLFVAIFLTG